MARQRRSASGKARPAPAIPAAAAAHSTEARDSERPHRRAFWLLAAFLAGAVAMALEIAAARLLAPYLGSSLEVWGCLISVILGAMATGYALFGRMADRWPGDGAMFGAILGSGLWQVGALFLAHPLLKRLSGWSEVEAALAAIVVLFAPPTLLLAGVGPCAIRLCAREHVGTTAGVVYALGALGSIAGVLLTSFVLLPELGTRVTLQGLAALSLVGGALGLASRKAAGLGLLALALPWAPERTFPTRTLWAGESIYHVVQVVGMGGGRKGLVLDQEWSLQTALDPQGGRSHGYWDDFAVGPLLGRGPRVLVLGMGGGASIRAVRAADPRAEIDAVEIDPLVVRVAAEHFAVAPGPGLRVHVGDARRFLSASEAGYDVIQMDLFRSGPEIPSHLVTREFFASARARLNPGGIFMANVFDLAPGRPLLGSVAATLSSVFSGLFVRSHRGMNHMIFAFAEPRDLSVIEAALGRAAPPVSEIAGEIAREIRPLDADPGALVLTDDRAPLERLTRRMMSEVRKAGRVRLP